MPFFTDINEWDFAPALGMTVLKKPATITHFQNQAKACRNMGLPIYRFIVRTLDRSS